MEVFLVLKNCAEDENGASTHSNGSQSEHNPKWRHPCSGSPRINKIDFSATKWPVFIIVINTS